jgi:hypothetical protein
VEARGACAARSLRITDERPRDLDSIAFAQWRGSVDALAEYGEACGIERRADSLCGVGDAQRIADRRAVGDVDGDEEFAVRTDEGDVDAHRRHRVRT